MFYSFVTHIASSYEHQTKLEKYEGVFGYTGLFISP